MGGRRAATQAAPVLWRIGEVAKQTGVTTRTLRYWEELGLLQPASRTDGGERVYGGGEGEWPAPRRRELFDEAIAANDQLVERLDETLSRIGALRDERLAIAL